MYRAAPAAPSSAHPRFRSPNRRLGDPLRYDLDRTTRRSRPGAPSRLRFRHLPPGAARGHRRGARRQGLHRGHAHRGGEVAHLPAAGPHPSGHGPGGLAADQPHEGPGRRRAGARVPGRRDQLDSGLRRAPGSPGGAPARGLRAGLPRPRGAGRSPGRLRVFVPDLARRRRRGALHLASGDTTSGLPIAAWRGSRRDWRYRSWRSPRPRPAPWPGTSCGSSGCGSPPDTRDPSSGRTCSSAPGRRGRGTRAGRSWRSSAGGRGRAGSSTA